MLLCYRFLREEKHLSRAVFNCCDGGSRTVSLKYMEWKYLPVLDRIYNFHNSTVVFKVPAQPHRCLQLFWLMRLLLSLKRVNSRSNESSQYDFCNSFLTSESPVCTALKEALLIKSSEQVVRVQPRLRQWLWYRDLCDVLDETTCCTEWRNTKKSSRYLQDVGDHSNGPAVHCLTVRLLGKNLWSWKWKKTSVSLGYLSWIFLLLLPLLLLHFTVAWCLTKLKSGLCFLVVICNSCQLEAQLKL